MNKLYAENNNRETEQYLFHQGTNYNAYEYMGCHISKTDNRYRYNFRVWAPRADSVYVIGIFSDWDNGIEMMRITDNGIWETEFESDIDLCGSFYKYKISSDTGIFFKADPYAFSSQTLSETASIITDLNKYEWADNNWMTHRKKLSENLTTAKKENVGHFYPYPMNIYEVHLGSWKTRNGGSTQDRKNYLSYSEIADELIPYVKEMGYTHLELMPIAEHPYDGSWGYQICGFFSPTSRYGTPQDFMNFVDRCHQAGIGIILDWVPAHFPKDSHGLYEFDGHLQYEYQGYDRMEQKTWGTRFFDVGRPEVQCFLISNAIFWFKKYHIDGLRIDAVASMLYLDYDRSPDEWIPNTEGNNKNLEAIAFFKKLNTVVFSEFPDVLMIAEESTAWPMITGPVHMGGLGFNFKWNMGWMNDSIDYIKKDPIYRQYHHNNLTFPMVYAYSENFILPISHDEVAHGKGSLIGKMFGSYDDKFAGMRVFYAYMMTMPGKKLSFMGNEFAQFDEWKYYCQLDWFLLDFESHRRFRHYCCTLNNFYLSRPELWEIDDSWEGFEWIDADRRTDNTYLYCRKSISGNELIVILNFSPVYYKEYSVPVFLEGRYAVIFNSDLEEFGGRGRKNSSSVNSFTIDDKNYIKVDLPPLSAIFINKRPGGK